MIEQSTSNHTEFRGEFILVRDSNKMSQFGAGKPGGWTRPGTGGNQMPGFGMGVGAFPMMGVQGMGVPMGMVNQAAFAQQNVMGMGVMGAVPSSASVRASAGQPNSSVGGKNQRTFVGVVTKMHDNYGFVDDDVFFQHSVIRGTLPRVGEKVMVEASYNPQMPFKWNAYRIQLLNSGESGPPSQNHNHTPLARSGPVGGSAGGRWGPPTSTDRNGPSHRGSPPRRRSPPRRSPRHVASPMRKDGPQRRKSPPLRRSPPPRRASPPSKSERNDRDRKRERSANPSSAAQSTRRESASPPRRRARIIPRYECHPPRPVPLSEFMSVVGLRTRYSKLYIPSDFADMTAEWTRRVPLDADIDLTNPVAFHVWNKEVDNPFVSSETETVLDPEDADHRHQVKVLLLAHSGRQEVHKKAFGLLPDGSTDDTSEPSPFFKQLSFLVGTRGKEPLAIGGSWSPSIDGDDPTNPSTIIRTAIRTTKALTGVDLSNVPQWYELVHVRYYRADRERTDSVRLLLPDTQLLLDDTSDDERWTAVQAALQAQLEARLAAVDTPQPEVDQPTVADDTAKDKESREREHIFLDQSIVVTPIKEATSSAEDTPAKDGEEEVVETKDTPTHWSKLDLKTLKVPELRAELEARGLETKGVKSLLCKRLQEALDQEKEKEEGEGAAPTGDIEMTDVAGDEEEPEEKGEQNLVEKKSGEKSEAELKKEAEEQKKKAEKLEKERQERKAILEKYYAMPKERKILVYPSKTAKGGKFDCRVMSMQSLLDYRQDDNKESHFEVSLFVEAFKELLERRAAFTIYYAIARAADKEIERKRRDEAREKKDDEVQYF
ncbi:SAP domain protein [Dictyocaulus viviparus]|uniref:SAP domain protein n=1 Tax=Dictyocaulus viviparus TaxID=29172 RepID=A0A0D8XRJ2_DICVI|nr:SAP domain protein [Dictyocaulus viviparus]